METFGMIHQVKFLRFLIEEEKGVGVKKYFVLFCLILFSINLNSASFDGTINIVYEDNHYIFSDGDSATGFSIIKNDEFWTEYYSGRWDDISKQKGKEIYYATFCLK